MTAPAANDTEAATPRLSAEELLLAQLGQTILAQRAQALAVIEQCDASLMVVRALQDREAERIAGLAAAQPDTSTKLPPMFGASPESQSSQAR